MDGKQFYSTGFFNSKISAELESIRLYFLVAFTFSLAGVILRLQTSPEGGNVSFTSRSFLVILVSLLVSMGGLILCRTRKADLVVSIARKIFRTFSSWRNVHWILFFLPILFFGYYHFAGLNLTLLKHFPKLWFFGYLSLLGAIFLSSTRCAKPSLSLLMTFSFYGSILWLIYFIPDVSTYPLSLNWSESSRFYSGSLFFSRLIYGKGVPLPPLHLSQYMMQSLPFLFSNLPLWTHRLWEVFLWLGMTIGSGMALAWRIKPRNRWIWLGLTAWFFLFAFQGPVYYHLLVSVISVLLGFNKNKPGLTLIFIALASVWTGLSRVNWFPMAGVLAATLFVLEVPQDKKNFWQYWRWPVLVVIMSLIIAVGAHIGYALISGNPPEAFTSSFSSPLLKYRLLENEAYGPGIINLTITASLPLLLIILLRVLPNLKAWRFLRLLALFSFLFIFQIGGFVVSSKIGGGNNLHNMDAYFVLLAVITAYITFDRFSPDSSIKVRPWIPPAILVVLAFLVPINAAVNSLRPMHDVNNLRAWEDIRQVQALIDERVPKDGEVLFIQHRHLLSFDMITGVEFVHEYDKVFLMEMAMSGNEVYLEKFWQDLESHRFDLIITEPLTLVEKTASDVFGEENNAWVKGVNQPLSDTYDVVLNLPESGMAVLAPKSQP